MFFKKHIEPDENHISFCDEEWCREQGICVESEVADMSINYCVTAKREWVEKNCPEILGSGFIREPKNGEKLPQAHIAGYFLEYKPENIGVLFGDCE